MSKSSKIVVIGFFIALTALLVKTVVTRAGEAVLGNADPIVADDDIQIAFKTDKITKGEYKAKRTVAVAAIKNRAKGIDINALTDWNAMITQENCGVEMPNAYWTPTENNITDILNNRLENGLCTNSI